MPRWAKVLIGVMLVAALGAIAFAIFQPVQVLPRLRPAPGYALVDQRGATVTSEDGRGTITLYTFVPAGCGERCDEVTSTMRRVQDAAIDLDLEGVEFRLATVVLDPEPDPAVVAVDAANAAGDGVEWIWLTGTEARIENVVGLGFRRSADPADFSPSYALVDGSGTIRGEYRYQTLADDADKIIRHLDVLGGELRNARGFGSFVYEAAHAFQCYP